MVGGGALMGWVAELALRERGMANRLGRLCISRIGIIG
jgi:hypothetical protein